MRFTIPHRRATALLAVLVAAASAGACSFDAPATSAPRSSLFVGIDVSGSFRATGRYSDALAFAAHYIYGHLNNAGGLEEPRALFVGSIGGETPGQAQAFRPIHDFQGKSIAEIEADLRNWFPPNDLLTDFNAYFRRVADLVQRQNLALAPITLVVLSDGIPDLAARPTSPVAADDAARYAQLDVGPLEYLARNVTIRVLYPDPPVAVAWERHLPRNRVRVWTVDHVVMGGWKHQLSADSLGEEQAELWKWMRDNVDFRVRRNTF